MTPDGHTSFSPGMIKGRTGIIVDDPRHGITPVERTLRSTQDFDTRDTWEVEVEARLIEHRYAVDVEPDGLPRTTGATPTEVDRCTALRAIVRDEETWHSTGEIGDTLHAILS